jgi:hypothetical protein
MASMRDLLDIFEQEFNEGEKCPQCGSADCTCPPGECDCAPVEEGLPMVMPTDQQSETEPKETESVNYTKTKSKGSASVTVSARAESMQELHDVLKLAGITLPKQEEPEQEVEPEQEEMPCEPPTEMDPDAHSSMPTTTDKSVITGVLRDRLRDYLRNSR